MRIRDPSHLTPTVIANEFALQLHYRIGGKVPPVVTGEWADKPDTFGPVEVIWVRWGKCEAHLMPSRPALALALDDYSRHFIQPVVEEWIAEIRARAGKA